MTGTAPIGPDRLTSLGWDEARAAEFAVHATAGLVPGRVIAVHREVSVVAAEDGDVDGSVSGRFRFDAVGPADYPAVGDWVALDTTTAGSSSDQASIMVVLTRRSAFTRSASDSNRRGSGRIVDEQVIATNVDHAFLVSGLDGDFNLRRLERYLAVSAASGVNPVIVLNKADVATDLADRLAGIAGIAPDVPVVTLSALTREGLADLDAYLAPGSTAVVLGSSGVGKSTLVNALLGTDRQATAAVRASDSRGRHTTTHRELLELPGGGLLIDTPGMREVQLWEGSLDDAFADIHALAAGCHFRNCRHQTEPRCAVAAAAEHGGLDPARLESFRRLQRELDLQARRQDELLLLQDKKKNKGVHKALRTVTKVRL
jgi:ribosome biogenesis GTPase